VRITGPLLSTGWTILGTTLPDFLPDSARPQFQTTRIIPDYRNHSSKVLGMALPDSRMRVWKTRPGDHTPQLNLNIIDDSATRTPLIRRHRHHVVGREPQDDRIYLFH
jgi:hypothetical protein